MPNPISSLPDKIRLMPIKLKQFDYHLPPQRIANTPVKPRDHSNLMVVDRYSHTIQHHQFFDLPHLLPANAVLVLNHTKVFPARLLGKKPTGGKVELLLLEQMATNTFTALSSPGLKNNQVVTIPSSNNVTIKIVNPTNSDGITTVMFNYSGKKLLSAIDKIGSTPLPPYIHSSALESSVRRQYQTIYAKEIGSSAAPTAGLHFTQDLLSRLTKKGIDIEYLTLHVGLGTFKNPTKKQIDSKVLHSERFSLNPDVVLRLNLAKKENRPIIAVGTTTTRVLESCADENGMLTSQTGSTTLFIQPGYRFKFINYLITNFHLPQSSLLMLVSAFISSPNTHNSFSDFKSSLIGQAYSEAIQKEYRFFSFGDAMLLR